MNKPILLCKNLNKTYQKGRFSINVLKNINFLINKSEIITIIGASGSGKSTFLHILGGLDTPSSGYVIFNNKYINQLSTNERAAIRNKKLGFIYQFHHLLHDFNVLENVAMPLLISKNTKKESFIKATEILESVGMAHRLNHKPSELSGGESQRVAIARALINQPDLVLADEPTGNLDLQNKHAIFNLLKTINNTKQIAFLIVTHDSSLAESTPCQFEMYDGYLQKK
ncbi:Lipoprotein-releasing system ATP-binding proteinLolD [Candidatus Providencia siddallii]|uniref:Lipoprotein-releasing system ATP-binding protein LolD n=1 Tax=Candidatus Providencia siddallii TaxID=1715285 RepID=A0A0M6W9A9_9GAMM|nr:Lipoprotein-releasing system ATP-binding proteinLolD [Candidatus Providencia siddallii]